MGDAEARRKATRGQLVGRAIVVVVVLVLVGFWLWVFSGAPKRKNPDFLHDRAWVRNAAVACERTTARIDRLPNAAAAKTPKDRADTLAEATALLQSEVDGFRADPPANASDARLVRRWITDWDHYLKARVEYAAALHAYDPATDERPRFLLPQGGSGRGVDEDIQTFADINNMPKCGVPGDV